VRAGGAHHLYRAGREVVAVNGVLNGAITRVEGGGNADE
jgi:hypothetical protein